MAITQDDHASTSAYVAFAIHGGSNATAAKLQALGTCAVVWTTTPWTLAANVAISVHPELEYCVVRVGTTLAECCWELAATHSSAMLLSIAQMLPASLGLRLERRLCVVPAPIGIVPRP
jgi:isoleucyl-tRNA synthetase